MATKVWIVRKMSTSARKAHLVNMVEFASTLLAHSGVIAPRDSPDPGARPTSTNAILILVKMMERAWMREALSDAFACLVSQSLLHINFDRTWRV